MTIETFWNEFITKYPEYKDAKYTAWAFGVDQDFLADLVRRGIKTSTTSAYSLYELDNEPLPQTEDLSIVLNSKEQPICVIQTTEIYATKFKNVTETHAYNEGEGDRSLAYWREAHLAFFNEEFKEHNLTFSEEEIVLCEEFECLYVKGE